MSMVTRCPACATVFRVTPQQLQAHRGQVRCGRCMAVFDGFSTLATLPEQDTPPSLPEPTAPVAEEPAVHARHESDEATRSVAEEPAAAPEPGLAVGAHAATASVTEQPVVADASPGLPEAGNASPLPGSASEGVVAMGREPASAPREPESIEARAARPARASRAWSVGAACLAALLAGQAAYAYRVELAADYPGLKPVFARICGVLGCSVPLPQRPKLINIEASDLQVLDPAQPSVIQLTATLRNHAGYEVGFPALDLVLTNTKEHTLARRIFMPEEYLEAGRSPGAGLAANAEITVRLLLDTGGLGAAGFRLALLAAAP